MAENKESNLRDLEKLALIAEAVQSTFKGKATIVFELEKPEYSKMINHFREIDRNHKQFSIDISGSEFHFILDESTETQTENLSE